jgi:choloylglycine hydrolase
VGDLQLTSFGYGTAAWGLPGDFSPPSRFVRAAFFRSTAPPLAAPLEAVSQAFHILDNFDIPIGVEFGDDERHKVPDIPSATQWTAVSDLTSKMFYYKTMRDSAVKRVDLNQINFEFGSESVYALDKGSFTFEDVTPKPQANLIDSEQSDTNQYPAET